MSKLQSADWSILNDELRRAAARTNLLDFMTLMVGDDYSTPPHIVRIAELLKRVERGEIKRLCVSVAPGAGKSTLLAAYAAWVLGRNPKRRLIACSAGQELADRDSRWARGYFEDPTWPFDAKLSATTFAQNRWDTSQGGGLFAVGVDGKITGWRGSILCDDMQNDAGTANEQAALWRWWTEVLMPRLSPSGSVVLVQQRWGVNDLIAMIENSDESALWHHVKIPAITDEGQSYWPEVWPLEVLEQQRTAMGPRAFETSFLGRPVPHDGALFKASWFPRWMVGTLPKEFSRVVVGIDAATSANPKADRSAIVTIGKSGSNVFVLDCWQDRVDFPSLLQRVRLIDDHIPRPDTCYVEDASAGRQVLQSLEQSSVVPLVRVSAAKSKYDRAESITGHCSAQRIYLPQSAPWLLDFERSLFSFSFGGCPKAIGDDCVDAFVIAVSQLVLPEPASRGFFFDMRGNVYEPGVDPDDPHEEEIALEREHAEKMAQCKPNERNALIMTFEEAKEKRRVSRIAQRRPGIIDLKDFGIGGNP
ncbi:MAG: hypothetical protein WCB99_04110 [Candidatus Cybelea sp.]